MLSLALESGRVLNIITLRFTLEVIIIKGLRIIKVGTRKIPQCLRELTTLPEDKSFVSRIYMMVHSSNFNVKGYTVFLRPLQSQICVWHIHVYLGTQIQRIII